MTIIVDVNVDFLASLDREQNVIQRQVISRDEVTIGTTWTP